MDHAADDERRLIEQVLAAPDDDAPRLVYADWLVLRGDPRGEFIQLQCRLAAEPDDANRRAMRVAENKLLAAHETRWLAPLRDALPAPLRFEQYKFEHVRGFVERAKLTLSCLPHVPALVARAPGLRTLALVPGLGLEVIASKIAQPSVARGLIGLELDLTGGGNAVAHEVAAAPALRNLTRLAIQASAWGEMAEVFAAPP